nr:MAG TPA: hypothetical protein [Caudoviricetes sp.]
MIIIIAQLLSYYKIFLYFSNKIGGKIYESIRITRIN